MEPTHYNPIVKLFLQIGPAALRLGGVLPGFLLIISGRPYTPSPLETQAVGTTEVTSLGWILFWFCAFVFGGIIGMFLYPLFRFQSSSEEDDLGPRHDKILIIGTGVLTALVLVALYLLTQQTLTALAAPQRPVEFVIEMKQDQQRTRECPEPSLITSSEARGSSGKPAMLKLTLADTPRGWPANKIHQQQPAGWQTQLPAQGDQKTVQGTCSKCHTFKDTEAKETLTLANGQRILAVEAELNPQEPLQVSY